jgi:hypothetical protein
VIVAYSSASSIVAFPSVRGRRKMVITLERCVRGRNFRAFVQLILAAVRPVDCVRQRPSKFLEDGSILMVAKPLQVIGTAIPTLVFAVIVNILEGDTIAVGAPARLPRRDVTQRASQPPQ